MLTVNFQNTPSNSIHLWVCDVSAGYHKSFWNQYKSLCSKEELKKSKQYLRAKDGRRYIITRAVVRKVLSYYLGCVPAELHFLFNSYGKPEIATQGITPCCWKFNVSHSSDIIVLAVTKDGSIGVDVERILSNNRLVQIAQRYFSSTEYAEIRALSGEGQTQKFYELWTLKEAYIKAIGLGLSFPLQAISFSTPEGGGPISQQTDNSDFNQLRWQIFQYQLRGEHIISLLSELESCRKSVHTFQFLPSGYDMVDDLVETGQG